MPQLATTSPVLLQAIFSVASWHLNRLTGEFDASTADHLYNECLVSFRAALNDPGAAADDSLLVAMTILHFLEELRGKSHFNTKATISL